MDMEEIERKSVCRLCLRSGIRGQPLEGFISYKLKFILPAIDLDLSYDPKICNKCLASLVMHYDFKSVCLENNEPTHNFMELELLARRRDTMSILMRNEEKRRKCGLCHSKENVLRRHQGSEDKMLKTMLEKCLPDLDKTISTLCVKCLDSLENLYEFVNNCTTTEEKIKNYFKLKGLNIANKIYLKDVVRFASIKFEKEDDYDTDNQDEVMDDEEIVEGGVSIKSEPLDEDNDPDNILDSAEDRIEVEEGPDRKYIEEYAETLTTLNSNDQMRAELNSIKTETKPTISSDQNSILIQHLLRPFPSSQQTPMAEYLTDKHTHPLEVQTKCWTMTDKASHNAHEQKQRKGLRFYNCKQCSFKTKTRSRLDEHTKGHETNTVPESDVSYVNVQEKVSRASRFKCQLCLYTTKYVNRIKDHILKHRNLLELQKCNKCGYKTSRKKSLQMHMANHKKKAPEVYKCKLCSYMTKKAHHLRQHQSVHEANKEVPTFSCGYCAYSTTIKNTFIKHLKTRHPTESALAEEMDGVAGNQDSS